MLSLYRFSLSSRPIGFSFLSNNFLFLSYSVALVFSCSLPYHISLTASSFRTILSCSRAISTLSSFPSLSYRNCSLIRTTSTRFATSSPSCFVFRRLRVRHLTSYPASSPTSTLLIRLLPPLAHSSFSLHPVFSSSYNLSTAFPTL